MKRLGPSCAAVFFLLLGTFAFSQEPGQEPKPPQHEEARPDEAKPPKQERPDKDREKPDKDRGDKDKQEAAKPPHDASRPMEHQQEHQAQQPREEHGRPAGKSAHIPDEKFHASFGRQHTFVVNRPVIVEGQPRFQYSGYWFEIVDPWPAEWLYTDDVYVDYIDGEYFLFDLLHPGVRVAVFVVM
jgi:hypothetical protein